MIMVGGKPFIPFKCAPSYINYSLSWLWAHDEKNGGPKRTYLGPKKLGFWKKDLDAWLRRRQRMYRAA